MLELFFVNLLSVREDQSLSGCDSFSVHGLEEV